MSNELPTLVDFVCVSVTADYTKDYDKWTCSMLSDKIFSGKKETVDKVTTYTLGVLKDNDFTSIVTFTFAEGEDIKVEPSKHKIVVTMTPKSTGTSVNFTGSTTYEVETVTEAPASSNIIAESMRTLASTRGDCVALIDHPDDEEMTLVGTGSYHEELISFGTSPGSQYCAAFTPWINISYDDGIDGLMSMPPSFAYLSALSYSIKTNASWLAVAGAARGQIPALNTTKPFNISGKITNSIAEGVYQKRGGVSINAITNIKPFGNRIWGNRTLKDNSATGEDNLTATSFLNIRNMISDVKKVVYNACKKYTFEQNNDILWINFKAYIEPTLNQMKTGAGLSGYKIIRNTTTEKAKLYATIKLYPLYAVEDFTIEVQMLDDEITVS
jgi:hypothetical protein